VQQIALGILINTLLSCYPGWRWHPWSRWLLDNRSRCTILHCWWRWS